MNYLVDYHSHSTNSIDGKNSINEMCQAAINKGINEIAITDHFEPTIEDDCCSNYRPNAYFNELFKAKEKFKGRLNIKAGVELGQPNYYKEISELLLASFPYDYVIGSAHKLKSGIDVSMMNLDNIALDDLCEIYINELILLVEWGKFDCIGHMDLIKRYSTNHYNKRITLMTKKSMLEYLFKKVISKGKGIEINTSGLFQSPKEAMPGIDVLKLYKALGGEILTIGSDSHNIYDVGRGIKDGLELAREAGFDYITVFKNRIPQWIRITSKKYYSISNLILI